MFTPVSFDLGLDSEKWMQDVDVESIAASLRKGRMPIPALLPARGHEYLIVFLRFSSIQEW